MGEAMEELSKGRDTGYKAEAVACAACETAMVFKGSLGWAVHGLEGDTRLERAYYVCPACGEAFFPPGSETAPARGSRE